MIKHFKPWVYLLPTLLALLAIACSSPPPAAPPQNSGAVPQEAAVPSQPAAAYPLEITDQAGRNIRIEQPPRKIISLAPSNTEIVYALGLEDRLVGVTEYCDYPEAAKAKPKIGGFSTVNIERVVEIQPDLVLAASIHKSKVVPQLERLGLTVLVLDPRTVAAVLEAIRLVGRAAGQADAASRLTADMEQRAAAVSAKTGGLAQAEKRRVLYLVWHNPLQGAASATLQDDLIARAGGINIIGSLSGYAAVSLEEVIAADPQVIIAGGGHGSGAELPYVYVSTESRLRDTAARRSGMVYMVDANVVSRPGPRIVSGLELFAALVHPELFGAK